MSIGSLVVDLIAKTGTFETDMGRAARTAEKRAKEIDKSISRMGSRVAGAFGAIAAGVSFAAIIDETSKAEKALAALDIAVRNNAGAAGASTGELADFSSELQRLTVYGDDTIQGMQALLLTFRQIGGPEFKRAQVAVLDLATALGRDLNSSALLVGRALADPVKGMTQLSRAGVVLTDAQQDLIKKLAESGKTAEAQAILLSQLESRFGGAARAARDTFGGAIEGLKNAFGDLLESKSGLRATTSAINELTDALSSPEVTSGADSLSAAAVSSISAIGKAAALALTPIAKLINAFGDLGARLDNKLFDRPFTEAEYSRIFGVDPRGTGPSRRRASPGAAPSGELPGETDDFVKAADRLKQQIALYGQVGEAAKIAHDIQSGALEGLSNAEEEELLALARRYDAIVKSADAQKKLAEEQTKAKDSIEMLLAGLQQQVATFEQGADAILRFRIEQGDLRDTFALVGEAADEYTDKLLSLTRQLELMQEVSEASNQAIADFGDKVAADLEGQSDKFFLEKFGKAANEDSFGEQFKDGVFRSLEDGIYTAMNDGAKKGWKGFLEAGLDTIDRLVAAALAKQLAEGLFGGEGGAGQWGWASKVAGAFGGGGGSSGIVQGEHDWMDRLGGWFGGMFGGGRANGGDVTAGTMYRVNEREGEFFRPNVSGKVIPLSKMVGGSGGVRVNQTINVAGRPDMRTASQIATETARRQRIASARLR